MVDIKKMMSPLAYSASCVPFAYDADKLEVLIRPIPTAKLGIAMQ